MGREVRLCQRSRVQTDGKPFVSLAIRVYDHDHNSLTSERVDVTTAEQSIDPLSDTLSPVFNTKLAAHDDTNS